jgi:hypothetical protein
MMRSKEKAMRSTALSTGHRSLSEHAVRPRIHLPGPRVSLHEVVAHRRLVTHMAILAVAAAAGAVQILG